MNAIVSAPCVKAPRGVIPPRVHAPERRGQGVVETRDERDARRAGIPRRQPAGQRHGHHAGERRGQALEAEALHAEIHALQDALDRADVRRRQQLLQRPGDRHVHAQREPPAVSAARGRSRSGRLISLPIDDTSSTPMNAKHMTLRPEKTSPADGRSARTGADAPPATPRRLPRDEIAVTAVHTAPTFGSHFPTPSPRS